MFMPALFTNNNDILTDWFEDPFDELLRADKNIEKRLYGKNAARLMRTDVKDEGNHYSVAIDLPGFKKDEVAVSLDNGYLTIEAKKEHEKDEEKEKNDRYIRRERFSGAMSRTFYVGDNVKQEDIKARFEDGCLRLDVPKAEKDEEEEKKKYITIN